MAPPAHGPHSKYLKARRRRDAMQDPQVPTPISTDRDVIHDDPTTKERASGLRRHDKQALADQVRALEEQLDKLRRCAGLPTREDKAAVGAVQAQTSHMDRLLHMNDLYLGRHDSMLINELLAPPVNTLSTFIHLPRDMKQRRAILRSMQDLKLRRGIGVTTAWLSHLDPTIPYLDEKAFTTPSGDYHYNRLEIGQFPNFRTARELYDTYVRFLYNMEISITEGLGQMTLREDFDDTFHPTIWNHRFVTFSDDVGIPEELNMVGFAQFYAHSPCTNSPMGIIVYDTVNIDDLYPYAPEERTCKEIQVAHVVFQVPKPGTNETVVVLKQCRFCVQLPPCFEVPASVLRQLQRNFSKWPNYIAKYLHEYVVTGTVQAVGQ